MSTQEQGRARPRALRVLAWLRPDPALRYRTARTLMYLCIAGAGVSVFFLNLPFMADLLGTAVWIDGVFLLVGGLTSCVGFARKRLEVEILGYPLLIIGLGVMSLAALLGGGASPARFLLGLLFAAFTFGLYGRSRDIRHDLKLTDHLVSLQGKRDVQ